MGGCSWQLSWLLCLIGSISSWDSKLSRTAQKKNPAICFFLYLLELQFFLSVEEENSIKVLTMVFGVRRLFRCTESILSCFIIVLMFWQDYFGRKTEIKADENALQSQYPCKVVFNVLISFPVIPHPFPSAYPLQNIAFIDSVQTDTFVVHSNCLILPSL